MGELLTKIKEAATGVALKAGIMEKIREDGTPVKKSSPAKRSKARRRRLTQAEIEARARARVERAARVALRRLRISRRAIRIMPKMPRLN